MREHRQQLSSELNLLPVMNLMAVLIPFLLMAAQFMSLSVIDTALPAVQAGTPDPDAPKLNLWIQIEQEGFYVSGTDPMLHPDGAEHVHIPCTVAQCASPETYDVSGLRRLLGYLKDEWPDEKTRRRRAHPVDSLRGHGAHDGRRPVRSQRDRLERRPPAVSPRW